MPTFVRARAAAGRTALAGSGRRLPVPARNEIQHPIVRTDENQRAGTAFVIGIPHGGIVAGPAPAVAHERVLLTDAPVQDDPNGMAGTLHIQQYRAVDVRQRRHKGGSQGKGPQTETLMVQPRSFVLRPG